MIIMKFSTLDFQNNPNIGLFAFATDKFCLMSRFLRGRDAKLLGNTLKVPVHQASVLQTGFLGIFCAGNSRGIIVSDKLYDDEIAQLRKHVAVLVLAARHTAMGNLILANDRGCIISKEIGEHRKAISDFLGVETAAGTIGGMELVGSLAVANSKGCLVYKGASEREKKLIENMLHVPVLPGSINYGNQWVKSGLIANSNGFLAGDQTSGPELGLISETLGFM